MREQINNELREHIKVVEEIASNQEEEIEEISQLILNCYKNNGKVILFGNGGSAADAQHIAGELIAKFKLERRSLPAISLTTNTSVILAIGNDYSFDRVFERQVEGLVSGRDVVIGISTSGNSENVIRGILKAKEKGAKTIAFTGRSGGRLKEIVDVLFNVPSDSTPRIQEVHITVAHIICGLVENYGNFNQEN